MYAFIARFFAALYSLNKRQDCFELFNRLESKSRLNLQDIEDIRKLNLQKL